MKNQVLIINEELLEKLAEKLANKFIGLHQNQSDSEELLDVNQASKIIKLTKPTLYGLVHKKKIPFYKKGKKLYFYKSELLNWISSSKSKDDLEERANSYLTKNSLF
jgi:excisionase family DNA binding protein